MSKPISLLVCALGGEGGGVLTGWLVEVARRCGHPAQATSIPGVAQRTGATTYFIEVWPQATDNTIKPVFSLSPIPGALDAVIASELLEAARCACNGLPSPERTLFIASGSRTFTNTERSQPGDGRLDDAQLLSIVQSASRTLHLIDMQAVARKHGTVVSAVMLGAIAGSGVFPFPRSAYEAVVNDGGRSAAASLAGFAAAFDIVTGGEYVQHEQAEQRASVSREGGAAVKPIPASIAGMPATVAAIAALGYERTCDYQDRAYGRQYLQLLQRVLDAERMSDPQGLHGFEASREAARWLALWMAYDDIIRVADLKSRRSRAERVRRESRAGVRDLLRVQDYFKPGVEEFAALLPGWLAERVTDWGRKYQAEHGDPWALPLKLSSNTVGGTLLLRLLASLRWMRRFSSRHTQEQALIEEWLQTLVDGLQANWQLGHEIAACGRLIKGYGSTNERGKDRLLHLLREVARRTSLPTVQRAEAVRDAREAALSDASGKALDAALTSVGAAPAPLREQPIRWMPTQARRKST